MTSRSRIAEHRALVMRLFPDLAPLDPFGQTGDGWTSHTYMAGGTWIVQIPRNDAAAVMMRRQLQLLPELTRELSAPIPEPAFISHDPVAMAYRTIEGQALSRVGGDGAWPERVGRFLYDLHLVPPEYVGLRSYGPQAVREDRERELATMREIVFPLLTPAERSSFGRRFEGHLDDEGNWRFAPCLTHGDIGPEHVLVSETGDLAGVIDWEEASVGDPAWDFAFLLHSLPEAGERTLAAYGGPPDPWFRGRAAFSFLLMPWHDVVHGLETGDGVVVARGLEAIRERADT